MLPLGYKAFLVAVNREACAKYKRALDNLLPPEWTVPVYSENTNDVVERPIVAELQLSEEREKDVRLMFKKASEDPKLLIVTDKLLTGFDAPLLYSMYLDKPMRDHVLLQAIARVNRPYVDAKGISKPIGLVVDFVGVLRELRKALQFDSSDVSGVIEDLELLMHDFQYKIVTAKTNYLDFGARGGVAETRAAYSTDIGSADQYLEQVVYTRFLDTDARKGFFSAYKEIEALWEILSPSAELRDHIDTFRRLIQLYAVVRNAYADRPNFATELAHKTQRLVQESAAMYGLGNLTKSVTFDLRTLTALRKASVPKRGQGIQPGARTSDRGRERAGTGVRPATSEGTRRVRAEGSRRAYDNRTRGNEPVGDPRQGEGGRRGRRQGKHPTPKGFRRLLELKRRCCPPGGWGEGDGVRGRGSGACGPLSQRCCQRRRAATAKDFTVLSVVGSGKQ